MHTTRYNFLYPSLMQKTVAFQLMCTQLAIEAPSFDLGIESDYEDLLKLIFEDSLKKDEVVADHLQDVEREVNFHHYVE